MNKGTVVKDWFKALEPQTNGAPEGFRVELPPRSGRKLRRDPFEVAPLFRVYDWSYRERDAEGRKNAVRHAARQ
jgi:hypothetical protein